MGVDCRIFLSPPTRMRDVAEVISACAGERLQRHPIGNAYSAESTAIITPTSWDPCVAHINLNPHDHGLRQWVTEFEAPVRFLYHFEAGSRGERLIILRSFAVNLALGKRLVDFFGGTLIYCDSDDHDAPENRYEQPERPDIHAEDGEEWQQLQDRILAVTPIIAAEIDAMRAHAAYDG